MRCMRWGGVGGLLPTSMSLGSKSSRAFPKNLGLVLLDAYEIMKPSSETYRLKCAMLLIPLSPAFQPLPPEAPSP